MNTVTLRAGGNISGMTPEQIEEMHRDFSDYDLVRRVERWSIREFMRENAGLLTGRVLDFGAGTQPYKDLVKGEYVPWSPGQHEDVLESEAFDAVMCNQVVQYMRAPRAELSEMACMLSPGGVLVMTFATNWDEVEDTDLVRYTANGMAAVLSYAGLKVEKMERRAEFAYGAFMFPLGYGCVARSQK